MQINSKLQLLIDNFFISFNGQNIFCQVSDMNNNIVFLNDYFDKQKSTINSSNMKGKSIRQFYFEQNFGYSEEYLDDIEALYKETLDTRQRKTFLAYAKDQNNNEYIQLSNTFPLTSSDDELLGSYTLSGFANPFNFLINFMYNFPEQNKNSTDFLNRIPKLGRREHQILFLLINRFSQYEIATFLQISRTTVQKIINDRLLPKFDAMTNDELITRAIKLKLHVYFPPSLLDNRLIIINNNESLIQQIANKINNK